VEIPIIGIYEEMTDEALRVSKSIADQTKPLRGEIITICVDIDYCLVEAISRFFLEKDHEKRQILQDLILDTTFLTLAQKKNILKLIMEKYPERFGPFSDKKVRSEFFENLETIIRFRNALAHGRIIIDYEQKIVTLRYYNSNKNETVDTEINPEFFKKLHGQISTAILDFYNGICDSPIVCIGPENQSK
jgi:hypothetical protein